MTSNHRPCATSPRARLFMTLTLGLLWLTPSAALAQDTCPEAPPDGITPASDAINNCLARSLSVALPQGNYLVTSTVNVARQGAELTSVAGQTATLVAATNFIGDIIFAGQGGNNYAVHDIHINGRLDAGRSCVAGQGANLRANGSSFNLFNIESIHSPCANWQVAGDFFHIFNNFLWHSGTPAPAGPVGDGLGIFPGLGGEVNNNTIADATDIALVLGGGSRWVHNNLIQNVNYYGLTGLNVGSFDGSGDHTGAVFENNTIQSGLNLLGIGLLLGAHPWSTDPFFDVRNAGTVRGNNISGAVINMVVEGVANIQSMSGNTTSNHQGTNGVGTNCFDPTGGADPRYEYIAWHFGGPIQGGAFGMQMDVVVGHPENACIPQG